MQQLLLAAKKQPVSVSNTTWNPADKGAGVTLSNNNLTVTANNGYGVRATIGHAIGTGKWMYEVTFLAMYAQDSPVFGIATTSASLLAGWASGGTAGYYSSAGSFSQLIWGSNSRTAYGQIVGINDTMGVAFDSTSQTLTYYKNGVSLGVAYTSTVITAATWYPIIMDPEASGTGTQSITNFGGTPFKYPIAGYNQGW